MTERIVQENGSWWIVLNGTNVISDNLLNELKEKHNHYHDFKIVQIDDLDNYIPFYKYMVDHPRLKEFVEAELLNMLSSEDSKTPIQVFELFLKRYKKT